MLLTLGNKDSTLSLRRLEVSPQCWHIYTRLHAFQC